jgi:GT2 family glycosyltransferase
VISERTNRPGRGFPTASVVVPTFDRLRDLERVIRAIFEQVAELSSPCEIVVVDDGSSDGTAQWLDQNRSEFGLTVLSQENAGPALARNRGVKASTGEIILFLGDDTVPQPGWLRAHLEAHRLEGSGRPMAVLGYTSFPSEDDSPFLRWINEFGAQFGYALIDDPTDVPFNFFYTSNISLPRRVFEALGGFRVDFPAAAWEDIEFAYRAVESGMFLRYLPGARTVHHHRVRVASFCARQETSGRSAAIFSVLHPELEGFLGVPCVGRRPWLTVIERPVLRAWIALGEIFHGAAGDLAYRRLLDGHYLAGLAAGLRELTESNRD